MISSNNFGKYIAAKRKKFKISQVEFANKLNVDPKTLSKWENGGCYPDLEAAYKIAKEFNVSLTDILNENFDTEIINDNKIFTFDNIFVILILLFSIASITLKSINVFFVIFEAPIFLSAVFLINILSFILLISPFNNKKINNRKMLVIFMKIIYLITVSLLFIL